MGGRWRHIFASEKHPPAGIPTRWAA
jgi:hypothetical protein